MINDDVSLGDGVFPTGRLRSLVEADDRVLIYHLEIDFGSEELTDIVNAVLDHGWSEA